MPIREKTEITATPNAFILICCMVGVLLLAATAGARPMPTSDLLLPYFEVDLDGGKTTYFAVVNASLDPAPVEISVHSNWGIEISSARLTLAGEEARNVDLGDWLLRGELPAKSLDAAELEHFQAALSGQRSPRDDRYYGTEAGLRQAVGYVRIETTNGAAVLFGDYFVVDPAADLAHGDVLIDVARPLESRELCRRHGLRFLNGGGFDDGTEVLIWSGRAVAPSESPYFPSEDKAASAIGVFRQSGDAIEKRNLERIPVTVLKISELGLDAKFGWLDLETEEKSFVAVRYAAQNRFSVGLQTYCLPVAEAAASQPPSAPPTPQRARLDVETSTNGVDADFPPGPGLVDGSPVRWTYRVTNTGNVRLFDVAVDDDQGVAVTCPLAFLEPGDSMECFGGGHARNGQYRNVGTARGRSPAGEDVSDADVSHYVGTGPPPISDPLPPAGGDGGDD